MFSPMKSDMARMQSWTAKAILRLWCCKSRNIYGINSSRICLNGCFPAPMPSAAKFLQKVYFKFSFTSILQTSHSYSARGYIRAKSIAAKSFARNTTPSVYSHGYLSRRNPWSMQPPPRFILGARLPQLYLTSSCRCVLSWLASNAGWSFALSILFDM